MTFKEQLHAHIGGLVRLTSQLYWYDSNIWDGIEGRVCIVLNTTDSFLEQPSASTSSASPSTAALMPAVEAARGTLTLLLIDGQAKWIWISKEDVEFIK
jgi:hypothetical protein